MSGSSIKRERQGQANQQTKSGVLGREGEREREKERCDAFRITYMNESEEKQKQQQSVIRAIYKYKREFM